jgi:4'-phosphopantetheinyl transferase
MPLVLHVSPAADCYAQVWEVTESASFFQKELGPVLLENTEYQNIAHEVKQLEWLASRFLAKKLAEDLDINFKGLLKDSFNKPYLQDSHHHLSISHSRHFVAAAIHLHRPVGVDIETVSPRLHIIEHKFLTEKERSFAAGSVHNLTLLWSAKEAMYKLWGKRGLHFQQQLLVEAFGQNVYKTTGCIVAENDNVAVELYFYSIGNQYLTVAI